MDRLAQDLRVAVRALIKYRNTSLIAVLCLALGIGANTAIFSVVNTVLLRPLPYADPAQLVRVYETFRDGKGWGSVSEPNFGDWREQNGVFSQLVAFSGQSFALRRAASPSACARPPSRATHSRCSDNGRWPAAPSSPKKTSPATIASRC
ncbi:MAG: ABC transporter permease [Gemmatimonadota bacterium]|nr:ABC transporter permease [Gemmatimonadota bacterium]